MMKRTAVLTTTHVDRHNESMTVGALEAMAQQINEEYLPFGIAHDPREPPIGRIAHAEVRPIDDGHFELAATIEIFEKGDHPSIFIGDRTTHVHLIGEGEFEIAPDRSHRSPEDKALIGELAMMLKTRPIEQVKKAVEPISLLELGGAFIIGAVATGFFSRLGEDTYELFKTKLKSLFQKRRADQIEHLFVFQMTLIDGERRVSAEIILTDPADEEIDVFFGTGLRDIDTVFPKLLRDNPDAVRFVTEWKDSEIQPTYVVLKTGVPVMPRGRPRNP